MWKCLVQHSGQTPQEGTYWARVSLDTLGSEISAINQNLGIKASKDWTRIIECYSANSDFNVPALTQYSEIMLTLQREDGRTTGSSVCPINQFRSGALYATGIDGLQATNTHYGVAVWLSNTHIEVAGTYTTARVYVR